MTEVQLQEIERRYAAPPIEPCPCGGAMVRVEQSVEWMAKALWARGMTCRDPVKMLAAGATVWTCDLWREGAYHPGAFWIQPRHEHADVLALVRDYRALSRKDAYPFHARSPTLRGTGDW